MAIFHQLTFATVRRLLDHMKRYIAGEHTGGRGDGDIAGGGTGRNRRFDERIGYHSEGRRNSIQHDARCAGESLAENAKRLRNVCRIADKSYKRPEAHIEAENCTPTAHATIRGSPVKDAIGSLKQPPIPYTVRREVETMQRRNCAVWRHLEYCPVLKGSAHIGSTVEVSISCLNQSGVWLAPFSSVKAVKRGYRSRWRDFEHRAHAISTCVYRCPIKVPIFGLHKAAAKLAH